MMSSSSVHGATSGHISAIRPEVPVIVGRKPFELNGPRYFDGETGGPVFRRVGVLGISAPGGIGSGQTGRPDLFLKGGHL